MEADTDSAAEASSRSSTTGTTRRRLLRTGVNVAVGSGLVWGVGADYATSGDSVQIVYARARSDDGGLEARTKRVPAGWHRNLQAAFAVQRQLAETELASVVGSFVVPGDYDDPTASLAVEATAEGVLDEFEAVVESVDVYVDVVDDLPQSPNEPTPPGSPFEVDDLDAERVPGGVYCRGPDTSGTLAPALFDAESGERHFATSNHVYGAQGTLTTEHRGEPLYLQRDGETRKIGRVERGYPAADVARIAPVGGRVPTSEIARASPSTVVGQYTRAGLADLMARDEELQKFGSTSGHTAGSILGVDGITCYTGEGCKVGQLRWGSGETLADGDSGSVSYHPDPENPDEGILVGGVNNARSWWPGADFTWGTAAYELLDAYGLHF